MSEEIYALSKEKRQNLISGTSISEDAFKSDDLDQLGKKLQQTKEASEIGEAWIVKIEPNLDLESIKITYLLQNGVEFTEVYEYSEEYLDETYDFVQVINQTGYDVGMLEKVLGEPVNVTYNKTQNEWRVDIPQKENSSEKTNSSQTKKIQISDTFIKGIFTVIGVFIIGLMGLVLVFVTRGVALLFVFMIFIVILLYLIKEYKVTNQN